MSSDLSSDAPPPPSSSPPGNSQAVSEEEYQQVMTSSQGLGGSAHAQHSSLVHSTPRQQQNPNDALGSDLFAPSGQSRLGQSRLGQSRLPTGQLPLPTQSSEYYQATPVQPG
ncbi:hypothetical protein KCU92_g7334, partial [Aureobasidium melanogenum]